MLDLARELVLGQVLDCRQRLPNRRLGRGRRGGLGSVVLRLRVHVRRQFALRRRREIVRRGRVLRLLLLGRRGRRRLRFTLRRRARGRRRGGLGGRRLGGLFRRLAV